MVHAVASPIPVARGALPLVGHALAMLRGPVGFLSSLAGQGDLVRIALGPVKAIMVCDPDLVHRMFVDDRTFDKGGPFTDRAREIVGNNLAFCPHADHRRQRRLLQPAFHPARLPAYGRIMSEQIAERVDAWHDGEVIDVPAQMTMLTTNVLTATLFSDQLTPARLRQSQQDADTLATDILPRMLMPDALARLPLPPNRRFRRASERMRATIESIVAARRAEGERRAEARGRGVADGVGGSTGEGVDGAGVDGAGGDRGDLLSALLAAYDGESTGADRTLSDVEVVNQVMTFHLAGSETTATTLAWALHLIATHPDVERRLRAELDTVLGGRTATYDDLPRLGLTGRVVTETLRLYSPAWLLTRKVTADTTLGPHPLPAGTVLACSPYLIHHRADLFEDPERFDPDRWDESLRTPPPRGAFLPFASGARKCIGDRFSLVEATLALASVVARWRFTHLPGERDVQPAVAAVVRPRRLRMRVNRPDIGPAHQ
ncbi:cytochrome P450 [Saccharothrix australiensis]|uniref:Pentalenene oxygenase n=1 Tax=Saccharothrix australiensis TaxID=2072 RepID=A0A495W5J6_9PSEU|nr:cytochrome P450 [Saccharothrix australiensis]RKT55088.1 pentalenene oxygenase [Saccharothrix australiensis]